MALNQHWYNRNENRVLPLADSATNKTDDGRTLPFDILVGAHLAFPASLGQYPFVSSVGVTQHRISLTLSVAVTPGGSVSPLGAVGVDRNGFQEGRQYPIEPQVSGVGGWVAFGSGADGSSPFTGFFSDPLATPLAPRSYRAYSPLPVSSLGAYNDASRLVDVVRLRAEKPLELVVATKTIEGLPRTAVVLQLAETVVGQADEEVSPLVEFLGNCDRRAESGTCGNPQPIEFLNSVQADCDGNLTLEFAGCAQVSPTDDGHGAVIDCAFGLSDACMPKRIPDATGELPTAADDLCVEPQLAPLALPEASVVVTESPIAIVEAVNEVSEVVGEYPYTTEFEHFETSWDLSMGRFSLREGGGLHTRGSDAFFGRHLAIWRGWETQTTGRRVATEATIENTVPTSQKNFGLVLNYPAMPARNDRFFLLELDYPTQRIRLLRGSMHRAFRELVSFPVLGLQYGVKYLLWAVIKAASNRNVLIAGGAKSDIGVLTEFGPFQTSTYYPDVGYFGIHSNRSELTVHNFVVDIADD